MDIQGNFLFHLDLGLWKRPNAASLLLGGLLVGVEGIMYRQHHLEVPSRASNWPRVRDLPRCESCSDSMVAPEASALRADGEVSYLWSCDWCGQNYVTNAANVA